MGVVIFTRTCLSSEQNYVLLCVQSNQDALQSFPGCSLKECRWSCWSAVALQRCAPGWTRNSRAVESMRRRKGDGTVSLPSSFSANRHAHRAGDMWGARTLGWKLEIKGGPSPTAVGLLPAGSGVCPALRSAERGRTEHGGWGHSGGGVRLGDGYLLGLADLFATVGTEALPLQHRGARSMETVRDADVWLALHEGSLKKGTQAEQAKGWQT